MSTCTSKKIQLHKSRRIDEETLLVQKQGIVTILGSNNDSVTSFRRTLSADMSSKKWLSQNGFSPMKKINSAEEISRSFTEPTVAADSSSSSEDDNSEEMKQSRCQIWEAIQKKENVEKSGELDLWSSILSKKANEESSKLTIPPYVHPLVKRSKSCLSEKSLQICTESLGSETGSDGFSSYSPSETEDSEEEKEEKGEEEKEKVELSHGEEFHVPKQNHAVKITSRSFPPPLPSLRMRSHRDNGRLFIQAVSVPSQNNFSAERQNGRLVLTFAEMSEEEAEEEFEEGRVEAEEFESRVKEQENAPMLLSSGIGLAVMMNKPSGVDDSYRSPKWSEKFNDVVNFKDVDVAQHGPLPPRPRARIVPSSSGAFSAYEYYCKTKPTPKPSPKTFTFHRNSYSSLENNFNSCKDSKRSFLFWEPYCIAT
ncbi:protein FAF-like, chloroplastic [Vigna umbellata]|uniref:protein FAF-like, chloroplastic n=1 Tax=Vigna umbellata TaxID=87088 RepID=UPI001F5FEC8F|nr:protein FAF-like, chloroplastic [Vigna umbellata]